MKKSVSINPFNYLNYLILSESSSGRQSHAHTHVHKPAIMNPIIIINQEKTFAIARLIHFSHPAIQNPTSRLLHLCAQQGYNAIFRNRCSSSIHISMRVQLPILPIIITQVAAYASTAEPFSFGASPFFSFFAAAVSSLIFFWFSLSFSMTLLFKFLRLS